MNFNPSPPPTPLQAVLERYQNALNCLTTPNSFPNKNQVLEILSARDTLGKLLETENSISSSILSELIELDSKFKKQAHKIAQVPDLLEYKSSLPTTAQAWLSDIEAENKSHPWKSFEWWLKGVKILIWTVNLALFSTLATRFLTGGSGFWEIAAIAFPGVLSLLQTQKELTKGERKRFYRILKGVKGFPHINSRLRKELAIFFSSFVSLFCFPILSYKLFLIFLILIWSFQPFISERYNKLGKINQDNQQLVVAEQKYLKAIALDSNNFDAHYRLATLYEELQEVDKAKQEYIIAAKGGYLPAYNNLAYWYIRQDKFLEAIALLEKTWDLVAQEKQSENFKQLTEEKKLEFEVLKYNLAKNQGWALLEAQQYKEAKSFLSSAIRFANSIKDRLKNIQPDANSPVRNPGAAHCLYAKLLETQTENSPVIDRSTLPVETKENWQQCQALIQERLGQGSINAEEYQWLYEAKQKLKNN